MPGELGIGGPYKSKISSRIREREIIRASGTFEGEGVEQSASAAIDEVLRWAQKKAVGPFPADAWKHQAFEQASGGRSRTAVRLSEASIDTWAIRIEDPDNTIAGRIWTTEIAVTQTGERAAFTARLRVESPEETLDIEPSVPGVIRQFIRKPGAHSGDFKLVDRTLRVQSWEQAELIANALSDPRRVLPLIMVSTPSEGADGDEPLFDTDTLASACAGIATVILLPAKFTWVLTERYGKRLSVYEGACRIYLPGFSADADPFGGHELFLAREFTSSTTSKSVLRRLRWLAAGASTRRHVLGVDLIPFATFRLRYLESKQASILDSGATDHEQLTLALETIANLKVQKLEAERFQQDFSDLHDAAEERANHAEAQLKAAGFRIQQLLEQVTSRGELPDANIALPTEWARLADWCDQSLAGRVVLTNQARRLLRDPEYRDLETVGTCLLWLGNQFRSAKVSGQEGSLRDRIVVDGLINAHCGSDVFDITWQNRKYQVDWHIKTTGNTRDPKRCLRIYYFWDESSQQVIVASLPAHRRTDAT